MSSDNEYVRFDTRLRRDEFEDLLELARENNTSVKTLARRAIKRFLHAKRWAQSPIEI
jgi:hypothetical protein